MSREDQAAVDFATLPLTSARRVAEGHHRLCHAVKRSSDGSRLPQNILRELRAPATAPSRWWLFYRMEGLECHHDEQRGDMKSIRSGTRAMRFSDVWKRQAGAFHSSMPVSWLSFLLLLVTGGGIIVYYDKEKKRQIEEVKNKTNSVKPVQTVGTAAIGGPFSLLNHDGKPVTEKDFLGKWTLLYFGFTHCPDICPDELQKMSAALNKIKFHEDLIGLTGTSEEIRKVARAYRVYYMKTEEEGSDYLVDHSIVIYLMNPKMEFVKFFGKNYDEDTLAQGIIKEIREHKSS
ncbi:hypothetical protein ACQ4PT_070857 [Festuca glaucescens]